MGQHIEEERNKRLQHGLHVHLLGRFRLLFNGADISGGIKYRKGIALLGYLCAHAGQWLTREQLADLLWPELELASARTNLRQVLNNLCSLLNKEQNIIHKDNSSIALIPGSEMQMDISLLSDASLDRVVLPKDMAKSFRESEIESWATCLGGEFLSGLQMSSIPEFDSWLENQRYHFQNRTSLLLERLCHAQYADGRLPAAITTARHLVSLFPTEEKYTHLLMTVQAEAGDMQGALDAFDAIERRLKCELEVTPDASLVALRDQIARRPDEKRINIPATLPVPEARRLVALYCVFKSHKDEMTNRVFSERFDSLVRGHGGRVISLLGHGILAVFGLSESAERPVQRAVFAARELISSDWAAVMKPHVGISDGQALLRPASDIPHLAGDMLEAATMTVWSAQPGEILVCEPVARQGAEWFCFEPAATKKFPGGKATSKVFRLMGDVDASVADDYLFQDKKLSTSSA